MCCFEKLHRNICLVSNPRMLKISKLEISTFAHTCTHITHFFSQTLLHAFIPRNCQTHIRHICIIKDFHTASWNIYAQCFSAVVQLPNELYPPQYRIPPLNYKMLLDDWTKACIYAYDVEILQSSPIFTCFEAQITSTEFPFYHHTTLQSVEYSFYNVASCIS